MGHLIQEYAKSLGVKISSPVLKEHYFPINIGRYITISLDEDTPSRNYKHYGIVLFILKPFLEKHNIRVVQLNGKGRVDGVATALTLPFKQQAYVVSKSLLHLGCDDALSHFSSLKKLPTLPLFGNTFPSANKPFFFESK